MWKDCGVAQLIDIFVFRRKINFQIGLQIGAEFEYIFCHNNQQAAGYNRLTAQDTPPTDLSQL